MRVAAGIAKRGASAVLVAALAVAPTPARAGAEPVVPLAALVAVVAAWTAETLRAPMPAAMPEVVFVSRDDLASRRASAAGGGLVPLAIYERGAGRILLPHGWTGRDALETSLLVHEMAHHLQSGRRGDPTCPAALEAEAFAAQARWLGRFGLDLADLGVDPLYVALLGTCGF